MQLSPDVLVQPAACDTKSFDELLSKLESILDQVRASRGSFVGLPRSELDLLAKLEEVRDFMILALESGRDRSGLTCVFGGAGSCRVARVLGVLDEGQRSCSEMNAGDRRWKTCFDACKSVEEVLEDLGLGPVLVKLEDDDDVEKETLRTSLGNDFLVSVRNTNAGAQASRSIDEEYDMDWSTSRELRVEVLSAINLAEPEYRLGDLTSGFFSGVSARVGNVYVEAKLEDECKQTKPSKAVGTDRSVTFDRERMLFVYSGELELHFALRDKRGLQSALRGDPLIGEGTVPIGRNLWNLQPHSVELTLQRAGENTGSLSLRLQLLTLSDGRSGAITTMVTPAARQEEFRDRTTSADGAFFSPRDT